MNIELSGALICSRLRYRQFIARNSFESAFELKNSAIKKLCLAIKE